VQNSSVTICAGADVHARGGRWRVISSQTFGPHAIVTLRGVGADNAGDETQLVTPFDRISPASPCTALNRTSRSGAMRAAAAALTDAAGWSECWTAARAAIDLREWQLEPARAVLGGATRVLLADDVGLGKTIQAGLIISELATRGLIQRTLVLTPASVRHQWADELSSRFGLSPVVFDHGSLHSIVAALPVQTNPWTTTALMVSSIDLVKRAEVRVAVDACPLDLLVVDEAHHLTPGSDRAAVVAALAARAPWVVLVTATPHSGDDDAYEALCRLGQVNARDEIRRFRRSAAAVQSSPPRRTRILRICPNAAERQFLDATMDYARLLWRLAGNEHHGAGLVGTVVARRAASCAESARRTLARRRQLLTKSADSPAQVPLPWADDEPADDVETDAILGVQGLPDTADETAVLDRLLAHAAESARRSSKIEAVRRLLRRTRESALIFSEYRDTAEWTASRLSADVAVAVLHGGLSPHSRQDSIAAFTSGRARVLVATDAAGEGLNLQAGCRLVVNVELPWNPRRLEQRIGRVSRIGQTRVVHALHLIYRDSFEDEVLASVERRQARAAAAMQSLPAASAFTPAAETRARRFLLALARGTPRPPRRQGAHVAAASGTSRMVTRCVLVFGCDLVDRAGRLAGRAVIPLECTWPAGARRRWSPGLVRELLSATDLRVTVSGAAAARAHVLADNVSAFRRLVGDRIGDLIARQSARPAAFVQTSLFDRRAEQHAHAAAAARTQCRERLLALHGQVADLGGLAASEPRLIAAWPEE
jgi:superfamily II DNA or RNA helicase